MFIRFYKRFFREITEIKEIGGIIELIQLEENLAKTIYILDDTNKLFINNEDFIKFNKCIISIDGNENTIFYIKKKYIYFSFLYKDTYPFIAPKIEYNNFIIDVINDLVVKYSLDYDIIYNNFFNYIDNEIKVLINNYRVNWIAITSIKELINNFYDISKKISDKILIDIKNLSQYNDSNIIIDDDLTDQVFTLSIFKEPVIAQDGFTYEKNSIERWFNNNNRSPTTGQVLTSFILYPNLDMKKRCNKWEEDHKLKLI
jgi:hypothetical protein